MSAKKPAAAKPAVKSNTKTAALQPWMVAATAAAEESRAAGPDMVLVCLQHPFAAVGDSSRITRASVPTAAGHSAHPWQLESVLEMNPPRVFAGWATRGSFTLDLSVHASAFPAQGTWGGTVTTTSGSGNCCVMVMRDSSHKVRFSLASGARHAAEKPMPLPDEARFLNADVAFELNGPSGVSAGAVAVISQRPWSRLIANSSATTQGLTFDSKWRHNMLDGDGDSCAAGSWAFAVMTHEAYQALCANRGWSPYLLGDP